MPDENVRHMWSDQKLDEVLTALHADVPAAADARDRVRAKLMLAANAGTTTEKVQMATPTTPTVRTRRVMPLAAAAAAIAVVTVGTILIVNAASQQSSPATMLPAPSSTTMARPPATTGSQHAPLPPAPGQTQNTLGGLASRVPDAPLAAGQFRYVNRQLWSRVRTQGRSRTGYAFIAEAHAEVWIPADQQQQWLWRAETTKNRQWVLGTEQAARADDAPIDRTKLLMPNGEERARCGDFTYLREEGKKACEGDTVGTVPTMNGRLRPPTEPRALYEWLVQNTATHADPPLEFFRTAASLLDARYSAEVRRATLQALSYHPYLTIADATTKDGRPAISAGIDFAEGRLREQVLLDSANGDVIGKRTVALKDVDDAKAGDVLTDETYRQAVVGKLGEKPAN